MRHTESQNSIVQVNQDVEKLLAIWIETNNSTKWLEALTVVQVMKNRA